ncbi:hypothetical protein BCR15_13810 [Tessaracoccus lapidicaptus]|jgi:hypothetical protein|uniref:Uncharacterized protein n=1 Tax=Tessaracoccus lapidicaptus TaxID=1427523 RepID=A0A1C0AQX6_9ACTN|nr:MULTISPECIES: hypothetical protein [Tessaracoccus]AQX16154.1 hypothetical protein BKM78_09725 [Tessaracoccus sp. T2.5-30]OCL36703.1 hypothetical protein BCR15_13810 [Tessaracoccus lapidicaptus]VEP40726.1 hypothetical protein TLA_TLA_01964 [Tessaracoccus lapidicaptus]
MQCEECHASVLGSLLLVPDHAGEIGGLGAFGLLRAVDTCDQLELTKCGGDLNAAVVADEAVEILRLHAFSPRRRIVLPSSSAAGRDATVAPAFASLGNDLLAALPMNRAAFGGDAWVPATYAEGQPWTRDPRGSRVQDYSPRIPHGKVTKWQSTHIRRCQGAIIG